MNEHQRLLDEARRFCDPATGEVIELIPEELMKQLRVAKLAVGIPGEVSQTATSAKWFVFLDDDIRKGVVSQWREANRKRPRTKRQQVDTGAPTPTSDVSSPPKTKVAHGLRGFLEKKEKKGSGTFPPAG
jgi:hypothetical protein